MRIVAMRLTFRIAHGMGFKPWSQEAKVLLRLILTTARSTPNNPWIRLTKREKVLLAADTVAGSSRARESIADALEVSSLSAWTFQRDLGEWLRASAAQTVAVQETRSEREANHTRITSRAEQAMVRMTQAMP